MWGDVRILEDAAGFNREEDFTLATYGSPLGSFEAGDFVLDELRREHFFRQHTRPAAWTRRITVSAQIHQLTTVSSEDAEAPTRRPKKIASFPLQSRICGRSLNPWA